MSTRRSTTRRLTRSQTNDPGTQDESANGMLQTTGTVATASNNADGSNNVGMPPDVEKIRADIKEGFETSVLDKIMTTIEQMTKSHKKDMDEMKKRIDAIESERTKKRKCDGCETEHNDDATKMLSPKCVHLEKKKAVETFKNGVQIKQDELFNAVFPSPPSSSRSSSPEDE